MKTASRKPAAAEPTPQGEAQAARLPLFYVRPQPVSSIDHAAWRLKAGDFAFAAETAFVPVVVGEIAMAARNYPIVFAGGDNSPLALTGLERANLFVEEGRWEPDAYVPAYARRYPFGFMATPDPQGFVLALDVASDRVVQEGEDGAALFEDGKPAAVLTEAMRFCDAFQGEAEATRAFCDALQTQGLLVDRRADATLPDGRKLGLDGFRIIDAAAFAKLPGDVVLDWHSKGWLALVHFHLASLDRFPGLLTRHRSRQAG